MGRRRALKGAHTYFYWVPIQYVIIVSDISSVHILVLFLLIVTLYMSRCAVMLFMRGAAFLCKNYALYIKHQFVHHIDFVKHTDVP